ncbi:hypothetical protein [Mycobacterium sp.]|uniref:hypothetical protein n=1 Tax=Mycobacterium sp. TaxID=1785 RepID=UPI002C7253D7|nr:hypothetical protein [Mycobacterium sp.]HTY33791.1 hypothetical protein [Mycobacterium sp.]HUO41163.1 hypothetical protein [Mycobacterium sp.]
MATNKRISPQQLSLAAAHGLTPSMRQSWSPTMVRTPRVLVPIELEVLMVRDTTQRWADCKMQTPPPPKPGADQPPTDTATLLPKPFAELQPPRERGAYLQWYLPTGLTSGTARNDPKSLNYPDFPALPDRWLIVRISQGATPLRRAVTGWVLEAGIEPPVRHDLASWSEPGPATGMQNPLTVLGHGDLTWAGYFDNVKDRLGFQDKSLNEEVKGPLAYLVCGWYADPTNDPLGSTDITSLADFNAAMSTLGWQLDTSQLNEVTTQASTNTNIATQTGADANAAASAGDKAAGPKRPPPQNALYTTSGSWWPTATVFHGAVVGIDWPGSTDTTEVGGPPDPASIVVAAGDTMAETMAALIAHANNAPAQAPIVEALQLGALAQLDQPDGRARLDAQLHATSFASQSGGPPGSEPITIAPSGPPPAAQAQVQTPDPGIFGQHLPAGGIPELAGSRFTAEQQTANVAQSATSTDPSAPSTSGQLMTPEVRARGAAAEVFTPGGLATVVQRLGAFSGVS